MDFESVISGLFIVCALAPLIASVAKMQGL
jgi:hypothetical protein